MLSWARYQLRVLVAPRSWTIVQRRIFLLTLPFSLVAWFLSLLFVVAIIVLGSVGEPLMQFWNAPRVRLRRSRNSYYQYSYGRRPRSARS